MVVPRGKRRISPAKPEVAQPPAPSITIDVAIPNAQGNVEQRRFTTFDFKVAIDWLKKASSGNK